MAAEVLVNEKADVLIRVLRDGKILPTSFLWRDRTRYVSDVGRTWEERVEGRSLRCYLVKTVDANIYELRWEPAGDEWSVHRAWLRDLAV
jgi:hypothetical protein